jgi:putative redox protein
MKSTAKWVKNYQSVVDNDRNHSIVLDLPDKQNGDDFGPTALELTVMSLSGCISTIFAMFAAKMHIEFSDLQVEVIADKPEGAETLDTAFCNFRIKSDAPEKKIQKCLDNTMKACPVGVLFEKAGVLMDIKLSLN